MSGSELADVLGVAEQTLANWRHREVGPCYQYVRGQVRYALPDVQQWFDAGAPGTALQPRYARRRRSLPAAVVLK